MRVRAELTGSVTGGNPTAISAHGKRSSFSRKESSGKELFLETPKVPKTARMHEQFRQKGKGGERKEPRGQKIARKLGGDCESLSN